ncbi:hypothetical protein B0H16DRAFT_1730709 [Mycena metata]|uniref:Uncharacterized protein n=1 Tax=Mycena metata TaxID=1033252 RepID=A0AAD7I7R5_9AGAR|nr:hypothetical protein B0H16DRAFT_1730709 [Mycena metata]
MFYDDYYNATTLNSIAADEDHALHFLDPVLNLFDPSNAMPEEDPFVGWTLNCESLLGFPINLSKHHSQDDPVTFDTPLTLAADASNRTPTKPAHKLFPVACMDIALDPSGADLCADDHVYAEEKRELFLEQQQSYATRLTPSPPLSEAVSSPSARNFDTPSPAADAASPTDNSPESLDHAVVEARVEIEVEFEDVQSDVDADGETDAGSELDEDADGEWDPDYEPAAPQAGPRLIIRLPAHSQSTAASSISSPSPLPPSTHDSEFDRNNDSASESESNDEDGDYGVRTCRPRSAPTAKRRRNNSGKAIAVAPLARREAASAGQIILPAGTPGQFTQGADGWWPCPLAAQGCAHPSFKNRDGLWRHWAEHLPPQPAMCPAGCGGKFKGGRRDVIRKHLRGGCKAAKKAREKCLVALKGRRKSSGARSAEQSWARAGELDSGRCIIGATSRHSADYSVRGLNHAGRVAERWGGGWREEKDTHAHGHLRRLLPLRVPPAFLLPVLPSQPLARHPLTVSSQWAYPSRPTSTKPAEIASLVLHPPLLRPNATVSVSVSVSMSLEDAVRGQGGTSGRSSAFGVVGVGTVTSFGMELRGASACIVRLGCLQAGAEDEERAHVRRGAVHRYGARTQGQLPRRRAQMKSTRANEVGVVDVPVSLALVVQLQHAALV